MQENVVYAGGAFPYGGPAEPRFCTRMTDEMEVSMAYDEELAERIKGIIKSGLEPGVSFEEKRMFGGVAFLLNGNMACGVHKGALIVRVGPEGYEEELGKPFAKEFDITGRPMRGWVMVAQKGCESREELTRLVRLGLDFALNLPAK